MILKKQILFIGIALLVLSCNRFNGPEKPKNLISKKKMVAILIDSKMLSSANPKNRKIMRDSNLDLRTYVFKTHNIDSLQFALSNNYYAFHMEMYEEIFEEVMDSLEKLNIKYKAIEAEEWKAQTKREEDSLKAITIEKEIDNLILAFSIKEKDSLGIIKLRDSIREELIKKSVVALDTLVKTDSLIKPVSDIVPQLK
jgi:hypothetical protein